MTARARRWIVALGMCAALLASAVGCNKREDKSPAPQPPPVTVAPIPAAEVARGEEACGVYVERVCACAETIEAAKDGCGLARALPDALRISLETAAHPDSRPEVVRQAQASARKTIKECIEQTARLPSLGCP
jgi:hypothetical protein